MNGLRCDRDRFDIQGRVASSSHLRQLRLISHSLDDWMDVLLPITLIGQTSDLIDKSILAKTHVRRLH